MMRILGVACVISIFSLVQGESPKFCHGLDCPTYTVSHTYQDYELRHYPASKWVGTNMTTSSDGYFHSALFGKLFAYISGKNAKNQKIEMTAPVLTKVTPSGLRTTYAMHFMIPFDLQNSPIAPTDPTVYLVDLPPLDVYVKTFTGFAIDSMNKAEVERLHQEIQDNSKFESSYYFTAGYDSPYVFFNRHNEVWLLAKGQS